MVTRVDGYPLSTLRHSAAHILASAVKELFPEAQLGIGPPIDEGFYYDFLVPRPFSPEDLERIEAKMREIVEMDVPFERRTLTKEEALRLFRELNETLKVELIEEIPEEVEESTYEHKTPKGKFIDWCRGPHVPSTGWVKHFKLTHTAGAYWRGDERRPMLQRIYGTAFFTPEDLEEYLRRREEAEKRDHRKLGRELGIFLISPEVGAGLPLWLPKGALIREILQDFLRTELRRRGYLPVVTPHIARLELFKTSGHWDTYRDKMYPPLKAEEGEYLLKPMNCPFHIQIYKQLVQSYRDLPLRLAEFGTVYRYEQSGEIGGLTRVRGFTQDDAHLFVTPDQLMEEFIGVVDLIQLVFRRLGLTEFHTRVGFRDPKEDKYVGSDEAWEKAQSAILNAVQQLGMEHSIEEGEAAFYGPKLDFMVQDALGRWWQLGTVQVDYVLPERFNLEYIGEDGKPHRPVMIHRAPFGSLERFIGVLIEHYAGAFPLWLAPVQIRILPIADRHRDYSQEVCNQLQALGFRAEVDTRNEKTGKKIRDAQVEKIPYMLILGDKEVAEQKVSVRSRKEGDLGSFSLEGFIQRLREEEKNPA